MTATYGTLNNYSNGSYPTLSKDRSYDYPTNGIKLLSSCSGVAIDDGVYVDGSWELRVFVEDLNIDKRVRVKGDLHLGGVMYRLVESIDVKMDWSDHALWWPEKKQWLMKTRSTLDQCAVQADARLEFRRMNNFITVQLPDLQERVLHINFAKRVFSVVLQICKDLGIRHAEELSLCRVLDKSDLRRTTSFCRRRTRSNPRSPLSGAFNPLVPKSSCANYLSSSALSQTPGSPIINGSGMRSMNISPSSINSLAFEGADESVLANSPSISAQEAFEERGLRRPNGLIQKARINMCWLDSSKTLMEQGVEPNEEKLLLRFKFYSFYDLNPKYDAIRINQLFEQAKWSIISEEIDCTEEEAMLLAALQFQVHLQVSQPQLAPLMELDVEDEIDAAISELEASLAPTCLDHRDINSTCYSRTSQSRPSAAVYQVPKLCGYLKFFKPKRYSLKHYRKYFFTFEDTTLTMFKDEERDQLPMESISLRNAEITPDVNLTTQKFGIKLFVQTINGVMQEIWLRCQDREQYADWVAACNLVSRGKTMASRTNYDSEVRAILNHLELQAPKPQPQFNVDNMPNIRPENFVASRFLKRLRGSNLVRAKILERHVHIRHLNLFDAKLEYIKTWQRLAAFGITYFLGRFHLKQNDILGITHNRVMRLDANNGEVLNTWRYREMRSWTVNWETKQVLMEFESSTVAFQPLSAPCKTVHEFIGGYVFLNLRTPEKSQALNEEVFFKLTGGNIE